LESLLRIRFGSEVEVNGLAAAAQALDTSEVRPGLDNTRLFMSLTAGAGTRCMSLLSSSPSLRAVRMKR